MKRVTKQLSTFVIAVVSLAIIQACASSFHEETSGRENDKVHPRELYPSPLSLVALPSSAPVPRLTLSSRGSDGEWHTLQTGFLYKGEWLDSIGHLKNIGIARIRWPKVVRTNKALDLRIDIPTLSIPRTLTVLTYKGIFNSKGVPKGQPVSEKDCNLEMLRRQQGFCRLQQLRNGYAFPLDGEDFSEPIYVVLNISWVHLPKNHAHDPPVPWGVWFFAVN